MSSDPRAAALEPGDEVLDQLQPDEAPTAGPTLWQRLGDSPNVAITLDMQPDELRLRVADDGNGFDLSSESYLSSRHLGLTSMRERAAEIGGTLDLRSRPGQGTEVIVVVPRNR